MIATMLLMNTGRIHRVGAGSHWDVAGRRSSEVHTDVLAASRNLVDHEPTEPLLSSFSDFISWLADTA